MRQTLQTISSSKNGAFIIGVAGIVIMYGIQRITELNYKFAATTKDGESISLTPGFSSADSTQVMNENDEVEGGEA